MQECIICYSDIGGRQALAICLPHSVDWLYDYVGDQVDAGPNQVLSERNVSHENRVAPYILAFGHRRVRLSTLLRFFMTRLLQTRLFLFQT